MKRVRGVDEVDTLGTATLKPSTVGGGTVLGSGGANLDYHSSSGIGVVSGQAVRPNTLKEMPGSIQFGTAQAQPQYTGAIVVPTAAPSPVKVSNISSRTKQENKLKRTSKK